ncbi:hypothetical protein ACA910_014391 [Epithemia clementina (nom. ined.)]
MPLHIRNGHRQLPRSYVNQNQLPRPPPQPPLLLQQQQQQQQQQQPPKPEQQQQHDQYYNDEDPPDSHWWHRLPPRKHSHTDTNEDNNDDDDDDDDDPHVPLPDHHHHHDHQAATIPSSSWNAQPMLIRPYGFDFDHHHHHHHYDDDVHDDLNDNVEDGSQSQPSPHGGYIYVSSFRTDQILVFRQDTGAFVQIFAAGNGTAQGLLNGPNHICIHHHFLYVTTQGTVAQPNGDVLLQHTSQILVYDLTTGQGRVFCTPKPLSSSSSSLSSSSSWQDDDEENNNNDKNNNNNNNGELVEENNEKEGDTSTNWVSMLGVQVYCLNLPPLSRVPKMDNATTTATTTTTTEYTSYRCRLYTTDYAGVLRAYDLETAHLEFAVSTRAHLALSMSSPSSTSSSSTTTIPTSIATGALSIVDDEIYIPGFDPTQPLQPGFVQRFSAVDGSPLPGISTSSTTSTSGSPSPKDGEPPPTSGTQKEAGAGNAIFVPPHSQLIRPIGILALRTKTTATTAASSSSFTTTTSRIPLQPKQPAEPWT